MAEPRYRYGSGYSRLNDANVITASAEPIELFISDPHGEYETFAALTHTGVGMLPDVVSNGFKNRYSEREKADIASFMAYPVQKMNAMMVAYAAKGDPMDGAQWIASTNRRVARFTKALCGSAADDAAKNMDLPAMLQMVREAMVSRLHVVGDVFDRGPAQDKIMDELAAWTNVDIQWGNHDILWMGAALGQPSLVATATRICARYAIIQMLEQTYGMDMSVLRAFADEVYGDDPCEAFALRSEAGADEDEIAACKRMQKAMLIIQMKVEAACIAANPGFGLESRTMLSRIDYQNGTIDVDGTVLPLLDTAFPTVDPADPNKLTEGEQAVMDALIAQFTGCERLQAHIATMLEKGSLYTISGNNLLFHACVPLNADGTLAEVELFGQTYAGKALFDAVDALVRDAFTAEDAEAKQKGMDTLWYLWLGQGSPLFGKSKMATFELQFVADKAAQKEVKNAFYSNLENEAAIDGILTDFGMDPATSRIICGHTPVKVKDGEDPVKCGGKLLIIDGGMSKPFRATSGVAGFCLVQDKDGMRLGTLKPFCGMDEAADLNRTVDVEWRTV